MSSDVTSSVPPTKGAGTAIVILTADQIADVLRKLDGQALYPIVALTLGTGMRRGEICGFAWVSIDLNGAKIRVERSLEETKDGLRYKGPKTRHGHWAVSLPSSVVDILCVHRWR